MQARERLGSELVGFQPQDHEILAAFIVISARGIPQDETRLREGLKAASVAAPFLSRFLDDDKETISESARESFKKLEGEKLIGAADGVFSVIPTERDKVQSTMKTYFKELAINMLKDAALAAQDVWFPAQ